MGGKNPNPIPVKKPEKKKRDLWNKLKPGKDTPPLVIERVTKSGPEVNLPSQQWNDKLQGAQKDLDELGQRPLRNKRKPEAVLNTAKQFADRKEKDGYEKAIQLINEDFKLALELAEKDGKELQQLHDKVNDLIIAWEKDVDFLGDSNELKEFLDDVKSRLQDAKTARQIQAVRNQLKRAPLFTPIPSEKQKDGQKKLLELLESEKADLELTEAKLAWKTAHDEALETCDELQGLGKFCPMDTVNQLLKQAETKASADSTQAFQEAAALLQKDFQLAATEAREKAAATWNAYDEAQEVLSHADLNLASLQGLDGQDAQIAQAQDLYEQAEEAWLSAGTVNQLQQVTSLAKACQQKIDEVLEAAKPIIETEKHFDEALRAAREAADVVAALPLADTFDEIVQPLGEIRDAITDATQIATTGARSIQTFTDALDKLSTVDEDRKTATKAAKEIARERGGLKEDLQSVKASLEELRKYPLINAQPAEQPLDQARDLFDKATSLGALKAVKVSLDKASNEIKNLQESNADGLSFARLADTEEIKARAALTEMKKLPNADKFNPLIQLIAAVQKAIDEAHDEVGKATDVPKLKGVISRFQTISNKGKEAADLSSAAGKLYAELAKADKLVARQERHAFLKDGAAELRKIVDNAGRDLASAAKLTDATEAIKPLADLEKAVKELREPKDKKAKKEIKDGLEARDKYDKLRKEAVTVIAEARKLRGARTDQEMIDLLAAMDTIVKDADVVVSQALNDKAVETASSEFSKLKEMKDRAGKRAEKLKKGLKDNLEARKSYEKALAEAEKTANKAAGLAGSSQIANQIRALISTAKLTLTNDPENGHRTALDSLKHKDDGYEAQLKKAEEASKQFKPDPSVVQQHKEVQGLLDIFAKLVSEDTAALYQAEVATALERSVKEPAEALDDLNRIGSEVKKVAEQLDKAEKQARADLIELEKQYQTIKDFAPNEARKRIENAIILAKDEIKDLEWVAAHDRLQAILPEAKHWADQQAAAADWKKKQDDLQRMLDRCKAIVDGWPPLSDVAGTLRGQLGNLKTEVPRTGEFKEGLTRLGEIEKEFALLDQDVTSQVPTDGKKPVDLEALAQARKEGSKQVVNAKHDVDVALGEFAQLPILVGTRNHDKIPLNVKNAQILEGWNQFLVDVTDQGAISVAQVLDRAGKAVKDFKDLKARITRAMKEPQALQVELQDVVQEIAKVDPREARERLEGKLAALERLGVDVKQEQTQLEEAYKDIPVDQKKLRKLQDVLDQKLTEASQELKKKAEEGKKLAKKLQKNLKKVPWVRRDFKEYYKNLTDRVGDIDVLLRSGDMDLVHQGVAELKAMDETVQKLKKGSSGKLFKKVKQKWDRMGAILGKKDLIQKRLPETYNQLRKQHQAAIAKAMETDPEQSLKDLDLLGKEIDKARVQAKAVDAQYKKFKTEQEALVELHKKLTKETHTWVTEKCEAFTKRFETQLARAKALAKTQGSMDEAIKALEKVRTELEEIRSSDNPREELQTRNGEAEQEQRLVRDLARKFEADKSGFNKVADKAEEAIKKAKKDKDNKGQVLQVRQVTRLREAASGVAKRVEPYLKTFGKQDADPPDEVLNTITEARKQLAELTISVRRLIDEPASTEVADPGELVAIEKEFRTRCRKLKDGVENLIDKIKSMSAGADTWPNDTGAPSPKEVKETVTELEKYFKNIGERFTAKRLVAPLKVLKEASDVKARKSAREKALREIQRMTKDLLKDDVLRELRLNPYRRLTTETSLLRATLKSLELAVLVGI